MAYEASPQELRELEEILKNNPELHFTLQALTDLWQQTPTEGSENLEASYLTHLSRMKLHGADLPGTHEDDFHKSSSLTTSKKHFLSNSWSLAAAAVVAVILFVAGTVFFANSRSPQTVAATIPAGSEISTKYGSKTNIVLPDGTKVWLNAGSKITYDKNFGEATRGINLVGEAYFDVIHNPEKPFVIHTAAMDLKVLGTEFNVKSYPDESTTEASLIRGSIEVTLKDRKADKIILKPNEKLVVKNEIPVNAGPVVTQSKKMVKISTPIISLGHLNYSSIDSTILETSWVNNLLVFEDESFEEVAMRMSRWYGVDFEFKDEEVQKLRFTGSFKNETVMEALKAMEITAEFGFTISDKHITVSNKRTNTRN
jgi:ferric-dicitrate binding protein FerR (iron transport regulator)